MPELLDPIESFISFSRLMACAFTAVGLIAFALMVFAGRGCGK